MRTGYDVFGIQKFMEPYNQFLYQHRLQIVGAIVVVVIAALIIRHSKNLVGKIRIHKKPETGEFYSTWCTEEEINTILQCSKEEFKKILEGG